ncbi:hypothetical protein F1880_001700 [Penicillium rolfsii]|nr:hypothetical protein F1880_001700 [Penicillium rolfsii]
MAANRMLMGGPSPHLITVYYHHKIEAIRIVSKALKDATDPARVSDDALIAIAVLSVLENSSGFVEVGRRHLDAFDRARFAGSDFPLVPRAIEEVPMSDLLSQIPQGAHFTLTAMFHELKCLSLDMTPSSETLPRAEWLERLNALGLSMHRMMARELFKLSTDNKPLRAYSIAGNIFLCRYLRALGEPDKERDLIWYPPRFLLWLLFVGGTAGEGRTRREWFRAQITPVRAQLGLESWDDTLNILSMFPFVRGCYIPYQALWEESSHASRASGCLESQVTNNRT